RNFPGLRYIFGPESFMLKWRIPYLSAGNFSLWLEKHGDFERLGSDIISSVRWLPSPSVMLLLADPDAIKEVTSARTRFPKPLEQYKILTFYGSNIVVTEGDEWKRHRKISAPSFSERNNRLVWDETMLIVQELREVLWAGKQEVPVGNIVDLTVPMALFIIGVAGFGKRMSWKKDLSVPEGYVMPFKDALHIVSNDLWLKIVLPQWLLKLGPTKRIHNFWVAYHDLEKYMGDMIHSRKNAEEKQEGYDLFSSLLGANEDEADGQTRLSDSELMGMPQRNEQESLYKHIQSVVPEDRTPASRADLSHLTYSMAVFLETLRMFPPVNAIPKVAAEDSILVTRNMAGEKVDVPCPKGTGLILHTPGLHYNPRYWEDPYTFKPSRFLGDWPRDAFLPFSGGPRSCLGRRFSETEGVAILTYIIKYYRVDVLEEPQYAGEAFEERKARLLDCKSAITLYPPLPPSWLLPGATAYVFPNLAPSISDWPGLRYAFGPDSLAMKLRIPYFSAGYFSLFTRKHRDFEEFDSDVVSSVSWFPTPGRVLMLADAAAIKEVTSDRVKFSKPLAMYKILMFYGSNVVVTEGEEWKRHRKISAPSFSERNNRLVWDETMSIMRELCDGVWAGRNAIPIPSIVDLTVPMALFVIGVAGFGKRMSWYDDSYVSEGFHFSFRDALHIVSTDLRLKLFVPEWVLRNAPWKRLRNFWAAYIDLEKHMRHMIDARKGAEKKEERYDLFSSLLDANDEESDGAAKLSDDELMGNIFIYLIAGHETTAHTIAFAFVMLALYQDEQEKLYQHIMSVAPGDILPSYEDMGKLSYAMAIFLETMRMFPPVINIPKYADEDTTLPTQNMAGENLTVPCPKGTGIIIHTPGLHYNPRYWKDPHTFNPSRFLGDWPRDAFVPFSAGTRSCLGRRFSETEGVAILTYMIKHFRVEVLEEPQHAGETFEQRKKRLLKCRTALTLYPIKAPLVFFRR
ncbi:cytochrome P450, partial [Fomitopsis betulina]